MKYKNVAAILSTAATECFWVWWRHCVTCGSWLSSPWQHNQNSMVALLIVPKENAACIRRNESGCVCRPYEMCRTSKAVETIQMGQKQEKTSSCRSPFGMNYLLILASCLMWNCSINKNPCFIFPLSVKCVMHSVCYMSTLYNAGLTVWCVLRCIQKTHISMKHLLWKCSLVSLRWSFLIIC